MLYEQLKQKEEITQQVQLNEVDDILREGGKQKKKKGASAADALKKASASQDQDIHQKDFEGMAKKLELPANERPWEKVNGTYVGLSTEFALARLETDGMNELTEKKGSPWYVNFAKEMTGFFSLLLWFGAFLCFIGYGVAEDKEDKSNLYLGIVLSTVVFITGLFSYQ
jgi:magnesium-transporting ATPase (P-type)